MSVHLHCFFFFQEGLWITGSFEDNWIVYESSMNAPLNLSAKYRSSFENCKQCLLDPQGNLTLLRSRSTGKDTEGTGSCHWNEILWILLT